MGVRTNRLQAVWVGVRVLAVVAAATLASSCGDKKKDDPNLNSPPPPNVTTLIDIGTKIGTGRVVDTTPVEISTAAQWKKVVVLNSTTALLGGTVPSEAFALTTTNAGRVWSGMSARVDGIATWSAGEDGTLVLTQAKRLVPKKPVSPKPGPASSSAAPPQPIDTLTFQFAPPGQKLGTPVPFIAADPDGKPSPLVLRGEGTPAVLGADLVSVVLELKPKQFAVAYASGPGANRQLQPLELPKDEIPVNAPFGRAPQLLTIAKNKLMVRPWPKPTDTIGEAKAIDGVTVTKTLVDELSAGPECEHEKWSFTRVQQPNNRQFILGVSPEKTVFFEIPVTTPQSPIGCSSDRVVIEAINPNDNKNALVTYAISGEPTAPTNPAFLVTSWPGAFDRELHMALTKVGLIAVQQLTTKVKWSVLISESVDGGKRFNFERSVGEGEGSTDDGYDVGALLGFGDRTLMLLSAKVNKTTRRSWYCMASDDNGVTWALP
ncbi:MAG: hypothetical protein U0271_06015 [Polyangiaceae bacterium]